jgi:RimJ/RimL family protein N-acetyltransferase
VRVEPIVPPDAPASTRQPDWAEFRGRLSTMLCVPESTITPALRLDALGGRGLSERVARQRLVEAMLAGRPADLIASVETAGELFDWQAGCGHHHEPGGVDRATLTSPRVRLRPIEATDIDPLYRGAIRPGAGYRWRFRGTTPSPADFRDRLFDGCLAQFVITGHDDSRPHGLVVAYDADMGGRHVSFGFYRSTDDHPARGEMIEGAFVFLDYLFRTWDFHKIYLEVPAYNLALFDEFVGTLIRSEGALEGHLFHGGVRHALHILAIYRDHFEPFADAWWTAFGCPS